ncbi:MAG: hypothetical protein ACX932_01700 [Gammaproteobacteria bacterium]
MEEVQARSGELDGRQQTLLVKQKAVIAYLESAEQQPLKRKRKKKRRTAKKSELPLSFEENNTEQEVDLIETTKYEEETWSCNTPHTAFFAAPQKKLTTTIGQILVQAKADLRLGDDYMQTNEHAQALLMYQRAHEALVMYGKEGIADTTDTDVFSREDNQEREKLSAVLEGRITGINQILQEQQKSLSNML